MNNNLIVQQLTEDQSSKISNDLQFILLITQTGKDMGLRVIIAGGYAVDAALGQITRPHNDMDIQIYGTGNDGILTVKTLLQKVATKNPIFANFQIEDKVHNDYYHNLYVRLENTIADLYYLQTKNNPFETTKIIVKKDGSVTEPHQYATKLVELEGVKFEAQNALTEIVDKLYKREQRGDQKLDKHAQDIENLKQIVSSNEIEVELGKR